MPTSHGVAERRHIFLRGDCSHRIRFRPFIASREEFFKGALLAENDTEFVIRENFQTIEQKLENLREKKSKQ